MRRPPKSALDLEKGTRLSLTRDRKKRKGKGEDQDGNTTRYILLVCYRGGWMGRWTRQVGQVTWSTAFSHLRAGQSEGTGIFFPFARI